MEGDHALVRDLKTGRDHPRTGDEADPTPGRDVQLGLYGLVARKIAAKWGIPTEAPGCLRLSAERRGACVPGRPRRSWTGAARGWLELAARLLSEHSFPPTPLADGCTYCPFGPVCGDATPARAAAALEDADGATAHFLEQELGEE